MLGLLWLVPVLPFAGFLVLALAGRRLSHTGVAVVGVGSIALSALVATLVALGFASASLPNHSYTQTLWTWMAVGNFSPGISFHLDALSLVFILVVTWVGALIHLYSTEYMLEEEGYSRFFAYMNLFVGMMLTLVLADNLVLLMLGWEGVGLCSYLLIGFFYTDPANGRAARKAFVVTRVGDTALSIGMFLLFANLGTLHIQELMGRVAQQWPVGSPLAVAAAALLLGGAVGKSAQLPLQTWLPDAMAGPTPVSALIHAATMVTAGVYLIARTHVLFSQAPSVMLLVAVVGALTLLLAGFAALTQYDIKRVLAYSTISQIGYMFLALGVGAWSAAIFHFMTHAFFKALLFLGAGAVILAVHHEQNMFKMGGLRRHLPVTFWTFLIGSASLSAIPLVTAGFYSKDMILYEAAASPQGSLWLWLAGLVGAFITAVYTFRMVFLTFFDRPVLSTATEEDHAPHGAEHGEHVPHDPGIAIKIPLIVLAVLAIVGGFVQTPGTLGNVTAFSSLLHSALPETALREGGAISELASQLAAVVVTLVGIFLAYWLVLRNPRPIANFVRTPAGQELHRFWFTGWAFDALYDLLFVRPFVWLAKADKGDFIDSIYGGIAGLSRAFYGGLSGTETGLVRWYAMGIALGAVIALAFMVWL